MNQQITNSSITSHLQINSEEEQNMLNALHQQLSSSLIDENIAALKGTKKMIYQNRIEIVFETK